MASFDFNNFLKDPSLKLVTLGVRVSTYEFGNETIQSVMLGDNAAAQSSAQANRLQAAQWSLHGQGSGITADLAVLYGLECNLHQVAPNLALWVSLREFFSASHKDVEAE